MIGTPVKEVKNFAGFIRITLDVMESQRHGDVDVLDAAISGAPAWLIVGFGKLDDENADPEFSNVFARYRGDAKWPSVYAFTTDPAEIGTICSEITSQCPQKPVIIFNLTDAVYRKPKYIATMDDE